MEKKNNINIAEILKDCPKGMKLYSPAFGESELYQINNASNYPIVTNDEQKCIKSFTSNGHYDTNIATADCILFPSSEMLDWSKFFKHGDVVIKNGGGMAAVFDGWANDTYTEFNTTINLYCDGNTGEEEVCDTLLFRKATEEERKQFIANAERILKGKYNPETLQVEPVKPKCPFKPFDKVLVRNYDTDEWLPGFFYRLDKDWNYPYHIMNLHHLTDYAYLYCIPYEGNEHLLGTTDPYTEGGSK